ncbi:MAG: polysaccharide biosynthesis/export family protein [Verrucomicrobiales bacterium]
MTSDPCEARAEDAGDRRGRAWRWLGVPWALGLAACAGLALTGCGTTLSSDVSEPSSVRSSSGGAVVLSEGDVIKLAFAGAPELNNVQKIRSDGRISLAMVGETRAAGMTVPQLQNSLVELYKPQLQNPAVLVTLELSANAVIISGEVRAPGRKVFDRPTTLFEAIMEAGGFTEFANKKKVTITRVEGGQYRTEVVDMRGPLRGESADVIYVRGGDVINVPE